MRNALLDVRPLARLWCRQRLHDESNRLSVRKSAEALALARVLTSGGTAVTGCSYERQLGAQLQVHSDAAECKIYEIAGQTVNYSFRSITRNITRRLFLTISH